LQQVLQRLIDEGLQSDRRFSDSYVRHRMLQGFGPLRIEAELRERGVADSLIDASLHQAEIDWEASLHELASRKFKLLSQADRKEQARCYRFLQGRGFPPSLIRRELFG